MICIYIYIYIYICLRHHCGTTATQVDLCERVANELRRSCKGDAQTSCCCEGDAKKRSPSRWLWCWERQSNATSRVREYWLFNFTTGGIYRYIYYRLYMYNTIYCLGDTRRRNPEDESDMTGTNGYGERRIQNPKS